MHNIINKLHPGAQRAQCLDNLLHCYVEKYFYLYLLKLFVLFQHKCQPPGEPGAGCCISLGNVKTKITREHMKGDVSRRGITRDTGVHSGVAGSENNETHL